MALPWWLPFGPVAEIAPRELFESLARDGRNWQLIDVRSELEFEQGHIALSRNVPISVLPRQLTALQLDPTRPVVAICLSGHRSVPAFRLLKRAGFQVYSLAGGMMRWWSAHLPTVKD